MATNPNVPSVARAADLFGNIDCAVGDPFGSATAVVTSDSTVLQPTRGLWVGVGGDVAVTGLADTAAVTFKNVPTGSLLWLRVTKVMTTNTTATNIVALR